MELSELKKLTLFESIMLMEKILKTKKNYKIYKESRLTESEAVNALYVLVDLKNWNSQSKELLLKSSMVGIHHFYFNIAQKKSLFIGGFNSIIDVINGKEEIYLYRNSIKWLPEEIKNKLTIQGIKFENLKRKTKNTNNYKYNESNWLEDAAGTDNPEIMNDVYWNLD